MPITLPRGIEVDEHGNAFIAGTGIPVEQIAEIKARTHFSPQEIQAHLPYLSREQVDAALDYYRDHQDTLDARLQERRKTTKEALDALRASHPPAPNGANWLQQIVGTWPGDESEEQINDALERLS